MPPALPGGGLAVPFPGGTLVVDGVTFTETELETPVQVSVGLRYLMFANVCAEGVAWLLYGQDSLYPVLADGTILPSEARLGRELAQLGTVQRLKERLARGQ
jgi:hypothetical protein